MKSVEKIFPLTAMQNGMLFHTLKNEHDNSYFSQHIIEMKGSIDENIFKESLKVLTERFEIFRTRIMYKKLETPMQVVLKKAEMEFTFLDLSSFDEVKRQKEAEYFLKEDIERGFDIGKDILCRVSLLKLDNDTYRNVWSFHHILMDGFCIGIIASDFFKIYDSIKCGRSVKLPEAVSYQYYQDWLEKQDKMQALDYWKSYLDSYEVKQALSGDRNIGGIDEKVYFAIVPNDVYQSALKYSNKKNLTLNILFQSAWGILLQAYAKTNDIVFGNVVAARPITLTDYDKIVGLFANTLPVRAKSDDDDINSLFTSLNSGFLSSVSYSYCSLGEIQELDSSYSKFIDHLYLFQNFSLDELYEGVKKIGAQITDMYVNHNSNYDFSVEILQKECLKLKCSYNSCKYSDDYIQKTADNFISILKMIVTEKSESISCIRDSVDVSLVPDKLSDSISDTNKNGMEYIAPSTEQEKALAEVFKKVLGVDRVGANDDFFCLGGNSIKAMQAIAVCEKQGIPLKLSELFKGCTISEIIKLLDKKEPVCKGGLVSEKLPMPQDLYKPFPLNDIQKAYIIGQDASFELGMFSTQYYTEFEGEIDIHRLERSIDKVMAHQAALRTKILNLNEQVIIRDLGKYKIDIIDISHLSEAQKDTVLMDIRDSMSIHTVSLDDAPYFQVKAVKLYDNCFRVCFNIDCLCIDGAGLGMMLYEIKKAYFDENAKFEPIEFTVRDYSIYQKELETLPKYEEDKKYWLDRIDTLPLAPELSLASDTSDIKNPRFLRKEYLLSDKEYGNLKEFAIENKVTVPSVICAAYMEVLAFWSGSSDFTVNMTVFDRQYHHHDVERMIGDFTKLIYIESTSKEKSFIDRIRKVNKNIISDLEHSSYSSMDFIRKLTAKRHTGTKAILPYVFTCAISDDVQETDTEFFKSVYSISRTPQVYIDNQVTQKGKSIFVNWDYPEGLFDDEMLENMFRQYIGILTNVSENLTVSVLEADKEVIEKYNESTLTEAETDKIKDSSLIDIIRESFEKYPDRTALKDSNHSITYKELDLLSDEAALRLESEGIRSGECIGIAGNRTVETVINMIAAVKCGITYVPINMDYPKDRIEYIIQKSNCVKFIDDDFADIDLKDCKKREYKKVDPESTAYIIFTSGSTGTPKGVMIKHSSAVNTVVDVNKKFSVDPYDKLICLASFGFDLSVYDVYGALSAGAQLYICSRQNNPEELKADIERENITVWNSVPAVMQMLISSMRDDYKWDSLRLVLMSGDWIPVKLPTAIRQHFPNAVPISLGGATEGSVWSIYYPIGEKLPDINSIPYGMPLSGQKMYVLNEKLQYSPIDVKGEICIGGLGVAQGYVNDPEKTEKAFIFHPQLGYLYRTGDYGKMHREGFIEFLGRMDDQVKIHGYRVELGEIEASAEKIKDVRQAVALLQRHGSGVTLLLFIETDRDFDMTEVKKALGKTLPDYMIPQRIYCMKHLPMTQNGKINREVLLEKCIDSSIVYRKEPKNEKEELVAGLWKKLLDTDEIDINRSLFEFGVDSLKAIQFITDIKSEGYEVSMMDIYSNDTIEKIAQLLKDDAYTSDEDDIYEDGVL